MTSVEDGQKEFNWIWRNLHLVFHWELELIAWGGTRLHLSPLTSLGCSMSLVLKARKMAQTYRDYSPEETTEDKE